MNGAEAMECMFCGKSVNPDDCDADDHGGIACRECGDTERETQRRENIQFEQREPLARR